MECSEDVRFCRSREKEFSLLDSFSGSSSCRERKLSRRRSRPYHRMAQRIGRTAYLAWHVDRGARSSALDGAGRSTLGQHPSSVGSERDFCRHRLHHIHTPASCRFRPATDLKRPAGMAERCARRFGSVGRVHQVVRAALARPPRTRSVAKEEAREKRRRQDQSSKHSNCPVSNRVYFDSQVVTTS
jgi:hypothetical protein